MDDFTSKCHFETEFHNSSSVWGIVLAVAARKIYLLGNLFVMAEGNNPSVPKKKRPTDRGRHNPSGITEQFLGLPRTS